MRRFIQLFTNSAFFAQNILLCLFVQLFISCSGDSGKNPSDTVKNTSYSWETLLPESQNLNSEKLSQASEEALSSNYVNSLLVVRNGYLVYEQYYNGFDKNYANNLHSASKSIMSAIVGAALQENFLQSLDQKMLDFFPEYDTENLDSRKQDITIKHLLTMTPGLQWSESSSTWTDYTQTGRRSATPLRLLRSVYRLDVPCTTDSIHGTPAATTTASACPKIIGKASCMLWCGPDSESMA